MLTVSKGALPAFISIVIASFSVSPAFGVASSDCPFVKQGEVVSKVYSDSFNEVAITKCDRALVSLGREAQLRNPADEAIRQVTQGMVFEPTNPLRVRVARARQGESIEVFSVRSPDNEVVEVEAVDSQE